MKKKCAWSIILLFLSGIAVPVLFPSVKSSIYTEQTSIALKGPSLSHLSGTDAKGRDMLWRSLYGASLSLWMGLGINILGLILGIPMGFFLFWMLRSSGMLVVENLLAIPFFVLGGIFSILIGTSISSLLISFGILFALPYAYMVQSYILDLQGAFFIKRSAQIGRSFLYICAAHIWPFIKERMSYQFWISIHSTIFALASMTFLGFGLKPPLPEWGSLIYAALPHLTEQPFLMITPFVLFLILAWAFFEISIPQQTQNLHFSYPILSIPSASCSYLVIQLENPQDLEKSLLIEGKPTSWTTFPQDYHQNFPETFSVEVFIQDLIGKKKFQEKKDYIGSLLQELDLPPDVLKHSPRELSGGMLQRLSLLVIKLTNPPSVLLGTPWASLNEPLKVRAAKFLLESSPHQTQLIYAPYWDIPEKYHKIFPSRLWYHEGNYVPYEEMYHLPLERQKIWENQEVLLTLKSPQTSYPLPILKNQHLVLHFQEIIGIVGHSGIGKTTLGKLLVGFLPLTHGEKKIQKFPFRADMILQNPNQFDENMKVQSLLKEFDLDHKLSCRKDMERHLAQLSLPSSLLGKEMKDLSKSEQYSVLLLRSILWKPHLLILDELLDHVEFSLYPKVLTLLESLMAKETQTCVVIISHKEPLLEKIADRIIPLQEI